LVRIASQASSNSDGSFTAYSFVSATTGSRREAFRAG